MPEVLNALRKPISHFASTDVAANDRDALVRAALHETLLTQANIGIAVLDRELRFVVANAGIAAIDGVPPQEHLGRTLEERSRPSTPRAFGR